MVAAAATRVALCEQLLVELQRWIRSDTVVRAVLRCLCALHHAGAGAPASFGEHGGAVPRCHVLRLLCQVVRAGARGAVRQHPECVLCCQLAPPAPPRTAFEEALAQSRRAADVSHSLLAVLSEPGHNSSGGLSAGMAETGTAAATLLASSATAAADRQLLDFLHAVRLHSHALQSSAFGQSLFDLPSSTKALEALRALVALQEAVDAPHCEWLLRVLHAAQWELGDKYAMGKVALARAQLLLRAGCQRGAGGTGWLSHPHNLTN